MAAKDINGFCSRCKGIGYINGYDHVQGGVCFDCNGLKSVAKYEEQRLRQDEKIRLRDIQAAKEIIVRSFVKVNKLKSEGKDDNNFFVKSSRKMAAAEMNRLKQMGVAFTIAEIEEMAGVLQ